MVVSREDSRSYESGVSDARSAYTHYKLLLLPNAKMEAMVAARQAATATLVPAMALLNPRVTEEVTMSAHQAAPTRSRLEACLPWFVYRLAIIALRRTKKDWNEVLRLQDYATMDYVPDAAAESDYVGPSQKSPPSSPTRPALSPSRRPAIRDAAAPKADGPARSASSSGSSGRKAPAGKSKRS